MLYIKSNICENAYNLKLTSFVLYTFGDKYNHTKESTNKLIRHLRPNQKRRKDEDASSP